MSSFEEEKLSCQSRPFKRSYGDAELNMGGLIVKVPTRTIMCSSRLFCGVAFLQLLFSLIKDNKSPITWPPPFLRPYQLKSGSSSLIEILQRS
jgi:hypothetical protein